MFDTSREEILKGQKIQHLTDFLYLVDGMENFIPFEDEEELFNKILLAHLFMLLLASKKVYRKFNKKILQ